MRDEVRLFLDSLQESKKELALRQEQIAQLSAAATRITTTLKDVPDGGSGDPHKDRTLIALADAKTKLLAEEKIYSERLLDVCEFINRIHYITYRTILYLRYVECKTWPEVTEAMEKMGSPYAERHIHRLHGKALNAARRLWENDRKERQ